ncbi:MAG: ferrous iron transport protein A [Firmicutes bacterium]|nr:ferrous iron transport protein A [Bacillota bacterium]
MENGALPLSFLPTGRDATIKDVLGGFGLRRKLTELGVVRGRLIRVVQNDFAGPIIISVGDGRLALGRGMAQKIIVEELNGKRAAFDDPN